MRTTTFIYSLSCPISGNIQYIGKSNDPKRRFSKHKQMSDNNFHKNLWISELKSLGLSPIFSIIEEVLISEWKYKEKFYIDKYRRLGFNLLNISSGANGMSFGNQTSFDGSHARKIVSLNKDGVYQNTFTSIKEAIEKYGTGINSVLKGITKTAYGFIWIYENKYNEISSDELKLIINNVNNNMSKKSWKNGLINYQYKKGQKSIRRKIVHQYTKDNIYIKTWESVEEASKSLNGGQSHISMCANGKRKTSLGFKWSYVII